MKPNWYDYLHHGSNAIVMKPDLSRSREDIDFGVGFYLTKDVTMAKKWASTKAVSILNTYRLNIENLNIYTFKLDREWLEYVRACRKYGDNYDEIIKKYEGYDVLIGATADDKLFDTVQQYLDGEITSQTAIKYLNVAGFGEQIVLKTQKAVDALTFSYSKEMTGAEKQHYIQVSRQDRSDALNKLNQFKKQEIMQKDNQENRNNLEGTDG